MAKIRFWNAEVYISQNMYENSYVAMYFLRILGICPLEAKRKALGLFLKFNPWYAFYSFLLGAATLGSIYFRIYEELFVDPKPTHTVKSTDKFVRFTAVNGFCLIVLYEVFIMPSRLLTFFKYIKYTGQVDNMINTEFSKSNRYRSIFMLTMPLIYNCFTEALDFYTNYKVNKAPLLGTLRRNYSYYTTYPVAFAVICINRYMANCLEIRIIQMNKILNEEYRNIKKNDEATINPVSATVSEASQISVESGGFQNSTISVSYFKASVAITKVTQAYLKWMKAAQTIRDLFGIILTVAMIAILCQMVASKYFLILALEGHGRDIFEVIDWTAVFSVQIIRLLLVVEPWHSCKIQLENLKRQACNILSLNLDQPCREKINSFAMILCLRQFQFSACGLFIVDRLLYTTLINTVVTFLVISLQAEEQDTN